MELCQREQKFSIYVTSNPSHMYAGCMSPGPALIVGFCCTNISANVRDEINYVT